MENIASEAPSYLTMQIASGILLAAIVIMLARLAFNFASKDDMRFSVGFGFAALVLGLSILTIGVTGHSLWENQPKEAARSD